MRSSQLGLQKYLNCYPATRNNLKKLQDYHKFSLDNRIIGSSAHKNNVYPVIHLLGRF